MGGKMFEFWKMTQFWIFLMLGLVTVLAVHETYGVWKARIEGKTKNLSRIVTHSLMTICLIALLFEVFYFGFKILCLE